MNIKEIVSKTQITIQEVFFVISEYLIDIKREDVEFIKFITHPQANDVFQFHKMKYISENQDSLFSDVMMSTLENFLYHCYGLACEHFKEKYNVGTFRVHGKNGDFIYAFTYEAESPDLNHLEAPI